MGAARRSSACLPPRLAATLVADAALPVRTVLDIASGPGAFLETFPTAFPDAGGIWTDGSAAMEEQARERLAGLGNRVEYRLVDMTELDAAGLPRWTCCSARGRLIISTSTSCAASTSRPPRSSSVVAGSPTSTTPTSRGRTATPA
jgi:hypothetical protein